MRKGADCLSKWVGESERQLRLLFDQVRVLLFGPGMLETSFNSSLYVIGYSKGVLLVCYKLVFLEKHNTFKVFSV